MKTAIVTKTVRCEICGGLIAIGETANVRYDYDWDNADEDMQGSITVPFYRHTDTEGCKKFHTANQLQAQMDAQFEEDVFRKAIH